MEDNPTILQDFPILSFSDTKIKFIFDMRNIDEIYN